MLPLSKLESPYIYYRVRLHRFSHTFPPCQKPYIPAYFVHTELHTAGALIKSFLSENAFAKVVLLLDTVRASGVTGGPMNPSGATSYLLA